MPIQYEHRGIAQNATIALSYKDASTGRVFFLVGQAKNRSRAFIFPGGQVDTADELNRGTDSIYLYAAKRELAEETGIDLRDTARYSNVEFSYLGQEHTPASRNRQTGRTYPAKDVHFFHAHLGVLDREAVRTLKASIRELDDLEHINFQAHHDNIKPINQKYMRKALEKVRCSEMNAVQEDARRFEPSQRQQAHVRPRQERQRRQHIHSDQHQHSKQDTSSSFNFNLLAGAMLTATGVAILIWGLISSSLVGLIGAVPLAAGLGLFQMQSKPAAHMPTDFINTTTL